MLKFTLTVVSIVALCCGGDSPKPDSPSNSDQKLASNPPCTCLLFAIEPVDEENSLYYAEFHPAESECAAPELVYPVHPNGLGDQVCGEADSCIQGAYKMGEKGGHIGCITPKSDWSLEFPEDDTKRKVLTSKILKFRPKSGEWITARIHLVEYDGNNPKLYRQVALGKEVTGNFEHPDVTVDDEAAKQKLIKKVGSHCHFDVQIGNVTYRVLTAHR